MAANGILPYDPTTPLSAAASMRSVIHMAAITPGTSRDALDKGLESYRGLLLLAFPSSYPCPDGKGDLWDVVEPHHRPGLFYVIANAVCEEQARLESKPVS